jgi:long-chain fatty acid transport protein
VAVLAVGLAQWPHEGGATGFKIISQSASGAAQSDAVAAQADDPSAVYYNPAGITQLPGLQISGGTMLIGGSTNFTQAGTGLRSRGDTGGSVAYPPPSNLYLTANLGLLGNSDVLKRTTVGVGVFSPFGLLRRFPEDGPLSTGLTHAAFELFEIKPVIAYKVTDRLSVSVGADIYTFFNFWGEGQAELVANSPLLTPPTPLRFEVNGRNTTAGFNASLRYTPCMNEYGPRCSFGFQYRSQAVMNLRGQALLNGAVVSDTRIPIVLPQSFVWAFAVWPVQDKSHSWKVEFDLDKTDWHSFRDTNIATPGLAGAGVPGIPVPRAWKDTLTYMFGTEYKWLDPAWLPHHDVALRGGYWYSQNAVPSSTLEPAVSDNNNHSVSVGVGVLCKGGGRFAGFIPCGGGDRWYVPKAVGLDLAYQALIYETRHVAGNQQFIPQPPGALNGTYNTIFHIGMVNLRVNF